MGLITGLAILILQRYLNPDVVHQLLTFNPADFFTCAGLPRARLSQCSPDLLSSVRALPAPKRARPSACLKLCCTAPALACWSQGAPCLVLCFVHLLWPVRSELALCWAAPGCSSGSIDVPEPAAIVLLTESQAGSGYPQQVG